MSLYLDQTGKIKYYKNMIAKELARTGTYPDAAAINNRIDDIDTKLAIFQHTYCAEGDNFSADDFNEEMEAIYNDLKIVYQLVYDLAVTKYQAVRTLVESSLKELESLADKYEKKMNFETGSTSLGTSVFFQTNAFSITNSFNNTIINLGNLEVHKGSKLLGFIVGNNFTDNQVTFNYGEAGTCSPYSLNKDYVELAGGSTCTTYEATTASNTNHITMFELQSDNMGPTSNYGYIIYGGKDNVAVKDTAGTATFQPAQNNNSFSFSQGKGRVTFYVRGASFISLDCSSEPLAKNFSGYLIDTPKDSQKITFEFSGAFSFTVNTDGAIYATKKKGVVLDSKLYYPNADNLQDFLIEEYKNNETTTISSVSVVIKNPDATPEISMIAVKEINTLDGVDADD